MRRRQPEEHLEYVEGQAYTASQLSTLADQLLREDARSEVCRECHGRGEVISGAEAERPVTNDEGFVLAYLTVRAYQCAKNHTWFDGEGEVRGIGGKSPILFEEHFQSRRRREIYTNVGTPDPSIVAGIYNRTHPQGRKVNSAEQRKKNGASFFR